MCLRLLVAAGLGGAIGLEREMKHRPAGLRTHVVVCVAGALLTAGSLLLGEKVGSHGEALRVAAGVVTGIGFIGAGTILQTRESVRGLTTAATVFMAAAIGITVGSAFYWLALTAAGLTVLDPKTLVIISFALCGFANFSSIAILAGGFGAVAPELRPQVARYGLRVVAAATLSNLASATIAGIFLGASQ